MNISPKIYATFPLALLLAPTVAFVAECAESPEKPIGVLLAVGDVARCGSASRYQNDEKVADIAKKAVAEANNKNIQIKLLMLGDLAYNHGTTKEFEECFDPSWKILKKIMLPVPGNHEYDKKRNGVFVSDKSNKKANRNAEPYFTYFESEPQTAEKKPLIVKEGPRTGYYAVRFPDPRTGPWLLLGLNPYTKANVHPSWTAWLESTLEDNRKRGRDGAPCILAFTHPFRFSSGYHGHNRVKKSNAKLVRGKSLVSAYRILMRYRASVLLSGHDHHFEQFGRQDVDGKASDKGIRAFIVGTGGGSPYLQNIKKKVVYKTRAANQEFMIPNYWIPEGAVPGEFPGDLIPYKFGLLKIDLYPNRYSWSFLPTEGPAISPDIDHDSCNAE